MGTKDSLGVEYLKGSVCTEVEYYSNIFHDIRDTSDFTCHEVTKCVPKYINARSSSTNVVLAEWVLRGRRHSCIGFFLRKWDGKSAFGNSRYCI